MNVVLRPSPHVQTVRFGAAPSAARWRRGRSPVHARVHQRAHRPHQRTRHREGHLGGPATARSSPWAPRCPFPPGAETHDLAGKTIMPGLVDTHSHIASPAGGDCLGPDSARRSGTRLGQRPVHRHQRAQAGGITTANVMPGSGHLLSGQTLYLKLRQGGPVDDFLITLPVAASPAASRWRTAPTRSARPPVRFQARAPSPRRSCASSS